MSWLFKSSLGFSQLGGPSTLKCFSCCVCVCMCGKRQILLFRNNWMKHKSYLEQYLPSSCDSRSLFQLLVQRYAVLCKYTIMGVHLHVWVAWNTNQNKGAFTVAAPSFWDVMTWICFFFRCLWCLNFTFLFGPMASESSHSLFWLWGSKLSTGNAAGCVFTAIFRHKCVFV